MRRGEPLPLALPPFPLPGGSACPLSPRAAAAAAAPPAKVLQAEGAPQGAAASPPLARDALHPALTSARGRSPCGAPCLSAEVRALYHRNFHPVRTNGEAEYRSASPFAL